MHSLHRLAINCLVTIGACAGAVAPGVVEDALHADTANGIGSGHVFHYRRQGGTDDRRYWLSVCLDLEQGEALRAACVVRLRGLQPEPGILVSGFRVAAADMPAPGTPIRVAIGEQVPAAVVGAVLLAARGIHTGPVVLRVGADEKGIISLGPVVAGDGPPTDPTLVTRLARTDLEEPVLRAGLASLRSGSSPSRPAVVEMPEGATQHTAPLLDLDLTRGAEAAVLLRTATTVWTADGLYLPGQKLNVVPQRFPMEDEDLPRPAPPYRAAVTIPRLSGRDLTVTLLAQLASRQIGQDNLFTVGRRSRWLAAQVGTDGGVVVGIDNRWYLVPARTDDDRPLVLEDGRWHVVTVAYRDADRLVRIAVDGLLARDVHVVDDVLPRMPPSRQALPGDDELHFADPGSTRHLHGLVRRLIVDAGVLDADRILDLHRHLDPSRLAVPAVPEFQQPVRPDPLTTPANEPKPGADAF